LTWNDVEKFIDDTWSIKPSYFEKAIQGNYPKDAFSKGQLASKVWLLSNLPKSHIDHLPLDLIIAILGCWIGTLVDPIIESTSASRVYGIDIDPNAIELAEKFNQHHVQDGWKFKGVVADASVLDTRLMEFETSGELISVKPNMIVNTSCEHMDTHWFDTAADDQLIIMQTNDSEGYDGHVNTCKTIEEMFSKYPMQKRMYAGTMKTPAYTRFMQIGYR